MKRFSFNDYISTALILLSIVLLISITNILSRVDNLIFDVGQKLHQSSAPTDVIIVGIDEDSLSELGRWPWSRKVHAQLINRLKREGAAVIGLDIIFSEPETLDEYADKELAKAIREAHNVVLPVLIEATRDNGQLIETLPLPDFMEGVADLGQAHAELDEDGIARSVYMFQGVSEPAWQHFSQAILNVAEHRPSKNRLSELPNTDVKKMFSLARENQQRIRFLGPSGHFQTISYAQVLRGGFTKDLFKNKIVLVGATASGMNDLLSTPVSGLGQPMSGIEVHANTLESIRRHTLISLEPHKVAIFALIFFALMPLLWLPRLTALKGLTLTLLYFVGATLMSALAPKLFGIWIAPSAALLAIFLAYPIWSWRKLDAAQKFLDYELSHLQQNIELTAAKNTNSLLNRFDSFDTRIQQVRNASEQLRFLQNNRKETLAFISHDLRAPLARALIIVEENAELKQKLHASLSQAIHLAEDFLQTSRAEMLDAASFKELDFASLAHQAVDEAYESAALKKIVLEREIVAGQIWMQGNFGLLQRAILNLLLNAVKFSPENAAINIKLTVLDQLAVLTISNRGAGISEEEQASLFKRFSRLQGGQTGKGGAGLGLYFVQTVAEKHRGTVDVQSVLGESTSFSLSLPVLGFQQHDLAAD